MIAKAGIQIHLKSPGSKLLYSGIERDMYITNFEISYINRVADIGGGGGRLGVGGSVRGTNQTNCLETGKIKAEHSQAAFIW